jgi:hypothetical protein
MIVGRRALIPPRRVRTAITRSISWLAINGFAKVVVAINGFAKVVVRLAINGFAKVVVRLAITGFAKVVVAVVEKMVVQQVQKSIDLWILANCFTAKVCQRQRADVIVDIQL